MTFRNFCPLLVSFSVISTALGQPTPAKPLRPAKVVPAAISIAKPLPVIPPVPRSTATNQVAKPSASPAPNRDVAKPAETTDQTDKSPQELLHTSLRAVKFDRTPNGILDAIDALSQETKPVDDKTKAAAEKLRLLANAGRWKDLGKHIASLPHEQSPETAYRHLIQAITRPRPRAQPLPNRRTSFFRLPVCRYHPGQQPTNRARC